MKTGFFTCREFRKLDDGSDEQRWICQACGTHTDWHAAQDGDDILSTRGWSSGFFDETFQVFCAACEPPSEATKGMSDMAKNGSNGHEGPDRTGKVLVKLSREEREAKGQQLAHERELFKELRRKKRSHVGEWNEQLRQMEETIDTLAEEVDTGEAYVDSKLHLPLDGAAVAKNKALAGGKKIPPKAKAKPSKGKAKGKEARA
jgi:hypothetical protein